MQSYKFDKPITHVMGLSNTKFVTILGQQTANAMQYPYTLGDLTPLSQWIDEDGDSHAIYQLPAPKRWNIRSYIGEDIPVELEAEQLVTKVRVCLFTNEDSGGIPSAIVVPFDEEGKESVCSAVSLPDTLSFQAVLHHLGFAPAPHLN